MIKYYLIGYAFGKMQVIFEDVKNLTETFDEDTANFILSFQEGSTGKQYTYIGNDNKGYKEKDKKAPSFSKYRIEAKRVLARPHTSTPTSSAPVSTSADDWIRQEGERVKPRGVSLSSCGGDEYYRVNSGCGGSTIYRRGSCGSYSRVTGSCGIALSSCGYEPYYRGCGSGC